MNRLDRSFARAALVVLLVGVGLVAANAPTPAGAEPRYGGELIVDQGSISCTTDGAGQCTVPIDTAEQPSSVTVTSTDPNRVFGYGTVTSTSFVLTVKDLANALVTATAVTGSYVVIAEPYVPSVTPAATSTPKPAPYRTSVIENETIGTRIGTVAYAGTWTTCGGCSPTTPNNSRRYSNIEGSSVTTRFAGTQIKIYTVKEPAGGIVTIKVDNGPLIDVDTYAASASVALAWASPELPPGNHAVVMTTTRRKNAASSNFTATFDRSEIFTTPSTRSGLAWMSGSNGDPDQDSPTVDGMGSWRGRPMDVALVFPPRDTWRDLALPNFAAYNFRGWPGRLSYSLPLWPEALSPAGSLSQCAAGAYDLGWRTFGQTLTAQGRGDSILRLGWAAGNAGVYWAATDPELWKQCFRRAAESVKATAPKAVIEWTTNTDQAGAANPPATRDMRDVYPGDEWVDVIGTMAYDYNPAAFTSSEFDRRCKAAGGLCTWAEFARDHGKKFAVSEWSLYDGDLEGGGGDNDVFVSKMWGFFVANADVLFYEAYFNQCGTGTSQSNIFRVGGGCTGEPVHDNARARYRGLYGGIGSGTPTPTTTTVPIPTATASPHRSGLDWLSGVNGDPAQTVPVTTEWETFRSRPVDLAHVYVQRSAPTSWATMTANGWWYGNYAGWPGRLQLSVAPWPEGLGNYADCADGDYDTYWQQFGTSMNAAGRQSSIVRIGWEANGDFMYWSATNATDYVNCFRKISTAIRATASPDPLIDWTINAHYSQNPPSHNPLDLYPGDAYADVIGIDNYDHCPATTDFASFTSINAATGGLQYLYDFAVSHGKLFSVGEWGVASGSGCGGGDHGDWMGWMFDWFEAHDIPSGGKLYYESYFSNCDPGNVQSNIRRAVSTNPRCDVLNSNSRTAYLADY